MLPLIIAVFLASLIGSVHCVGMCGPLAILAGSTHGTSQRRWGTIVAYHGGRVVSYGLAGAVVVGDGGWDRVDWRLVGAQQLAAKLAGGSMLVIGLLSLVRLMVARAIAFGCQPGFNVDWPSRMHGLASNLRCAELR